MTEFNFDEFESEFEHLDTSGLGRSSSGPDPEWVRLWLESMHEEPMDEKLGPEAGLSPSEIGPQYESWLARKVAALEAGQRLGEFTIEVEGELDEERGGHGIDSRFTVSFNGRLGLHLSNLLKSAAAARRIQAAMEAAMNGSSPEELLDENGISLQQEVEMIEAFAWLLVDVGTGRVDKVDLPGREG